MAKSCRKNVLHGDSFFQNWGEEIIEIALGVSITKQGTTFTLDYGRNFFAKLGNSYI
jgi:hypothetical protein